MKKSGNLTIANWLSKRFEQQFPELAGIGVALSAERVSRDVSDGMFFDRAVIIAIPERGPALATLLCPALIKEQAVGGRDLRKHLNAIIPWLKIKRVRMAKHCKDSMDSIQNLSGRIFNIQKFSVHDGPGIRTTVFLKGCPLRCFWCSNPESQSPAPDLFLNLRKCVGGSTCGRCIEVCPHGAIAASADGDIVIDRSRCSRCGICAGVCEPKAIELVGYTISVSALVDKINQDGIFYSYSGGGITLSGGEPLMQPDFTIAVFKRALETGLVTAMETCACAPYSYMKAACDHLDYLLVDIKTMDRDAHKKATGLGNDRILSNIARVLKDYPKLPVTVRMPIIPGFNDSRASVGDVARFVGGNGSAKLELLPYHRLGESKYKFLGKPYSISELRPPGKDLMEELKAVAAKYAVVC